MGSNMQRQAVPLMVTQRFLWLGKFKAATDLVFACWLMTAPLKALTVMARSFHLEDGADTYELIKFMRPNQGTCVNQRPAVYVGDVVKKGDVLADGPATKDGEISLGKNALTWLQTWVANQEGRCSERKAGPRGYLHLYPLLRSERKPAILLGPEEVTRDIPNVGDDSLKDLDDRGIIRIGAEVKTGDILEGRFTGRVKPN